MSKGSSPRRLPAFWNPARGVWETSETNLFCEHSELYSATWPASGSMRNGVASKPAMSAPPTAAAASSSAPGRLMPTPRTSDTNGAGTHGDGGMDLRTAVSLLPTPAARDWKSGESNLIGTNARPLNEVVVNLLPTPTASNPNDGESLESWEARRQRNLEKGINGNGQGTPLAIAVKLLPTPMAGDAKGTRNATAGRSKDNPNVNEGWTLSDVIYDGQLSNPSAQPAGAASGCTTPEASAPDRAEDPAPTPNSGGLASLLPTPRATRGGSATETMYRLGAERTDESRPQGEVLLPTPAAADGERTSLSYGRGNPTLTGAITSPPSDGGSGSSDAPHPGQLTLLDD